MAEERQDEFEGEFDDDDDDEVDAAVERQPVASARREPPLRLSLKVPVPPLVRGVFKRSKQDPSTEVYKVIAALFRKLTPERGPEHKGPLPGELYYFQRLLDAPTETLSKAERGFVIVLRAQEEFAEVVEMEGSELAHRTCRLVERMLARSVSGLQRVIRTERGEDAAQLEWESNRP